MKINPEISNIPEWSRNVIWYQIFPERFRNGDPSNDPRKEDIQKTFPEEVPENWEVSKWGSNWYREDVYMKELEGMDFAAKAQLRRYGGDLQGVLDKVDYLAELGITGVYFNPLNDAPSLHKYDPRHWRHVDRNFGPDPDGDIAVMEREIPDDPTTWQWTSADKLFLEVIGAFKSKGIRVIMDYSWNHTGYDFWAVNDIRNRGKESSYKDWFVIERYNDPATTEDETRIEGWWGFKYLPLIRQRVESPRHRPPYEGNLASDSLKQHIFNVSRRWLDPKEDGSMEGGIDGFRLDVAAEMSMGWWRDYRKFIRSLNPEAVLIGEVWWFDWEDMIGVEKMVQGDQFDAVMNYRWYALSRGLFTQTEPALKPSEFVEKYTDLVKDISMESQQAMMNIVATHDTPRIVTSLFNESRFDVGSKLSENPHYKHNRPDASTWKLLRTYLLHQFTFVGAPHIWNGDELGMWGANDPDNRKPIWWEDIEFEPEVNISSGDPVRHQDVVKPDLDLLIYYRRLIEMRKRYQVLAFGGIDYLIQDDQNMLFGYKRFYGKEETMVFFNLSDKVQNIEHIVANGAYHDLLGDEIIRVTDNTLVLELSPKTGRALFSVEN